MPQKNYYEKVRKLAAYCAVQYKILGMYDPNADISSMLEEISQPVIKAMRKRRKRRLKSLEEISKKTDERILTLQKQKPEIANSEEFKKTIKILNEMRKEDNN
ncbi:MAG: hypothetical protein ABIH65_01925 [Nanoarchaeota archaeon]